MTSMKEAMRTSFGTQRRIIAMIMLDMISTKVVASPMARALVTELVTASTGQSPSNMTNVGFSRSIPRVNISSLAPPVASPALPASTATVSVVICAPFTEYFQVLFHEWYRASGVRDQHVGDGAGRNSGAADRLDLPGIRFLAGFHQHDGMQNLRLSFVEL